MTKTVYNLDRYATVYGKTANAENVATCPLLTAAGRVTQLVHGNFRSRQKNGRINESGSEMFAGRVN